MGRMNKFTGELLPWKTISNVDPDEGINKDPGEDLCRLEDFESIGAVCARFMNSGYDNSKEFAYVKPSEDGLDQDCVTDLYDDNEDDLMNTQVDLEDYLNSHPAQAVGNDFTQGSNNSEKSAQETNNGEEQGGVSEASDDGS